jgi:hypothetical protein
VSLPVFIGSGAAHAGALGLGIGPAQQSRGPHRPPSEPRCQPCAVTGLGSESVIRDVPGGRSPGHDLDLDFLGLGFCGERQSDPKGLSFISNRQRRKKGTFLCVGVGGDRTHAGPPQWSRATHVTVLFWCGGDCAVQAPIARQRGSLAQPAFLRGIRCSVGFAVKGAV